MDLFDGKMKLDVPEDFRCLSDEEKGCFFHGDVKPQVVLEDEAGGQLALLLTDRMAQSIHLDSVCSDFGEDPGICVLEKRNLRRKSVKKRAGREKKKTGALGGFGSRMGAVFLAVFCLWIGTADFLAYIKKPEAVVRIYPAHTRSLMELLKQAETLEEMEQIADRILRYNESVSLAYDAKGNVAYAEGDAEKMIACKLRAIALARYEREEYEDYLERLFTFIRLYQNAGMTRSASYCRERLLEIPDMLEEVKRTTSPLAWMIYDKPDLELTKEMQARIRILRESEP